MGTPTLTRVLCVAAHPDDEVLGCGATLRKWAKKGHEVRVLILCGRSPEHLDMATAAARIGGWETVYGPPRYLDQRLDTCGVSIVAEPIEGLVREWWPGIVYTHSRGDLNADHRMVHEATLVACRPTNSAMRSPCIYAYEVPSSSEWGAGFHPQRFEPFDRWEDKAELLDAYAAEMREWPCPRSMVGCSALAAVRGATVCAARAEAFEVIREVV